MSKFRTIDVSNPRFETENLRYITVKSQHLKGRGDITVFIPDGIKDKKNIPLVILLHGVYGSHWCWTAKGGVHVTARELMKSGVMDPMIIAMPSDGLWGDGSAYLPHQEQNFEKWIVEDVPLAIEEAVEEFSTEASSIFISGLSMGGYGALYLGAKYPQLFSGISAHSSITQLSDLQQFIEEDVAEISKSITQTSVIDLMMDNVGNLPRFRFDCGKDDLLIESNRKLNKQLKAANISHIYEEYSGRHEWNYWEKHISKTLIFFQGLTR